MKHQHQRRHRGGASRAFIDSAFAEALSGGRKTGHSFRVKPNHKARMLCRQIFRTITLMLAGECGDDVLRDVVVIDVVPATADGSQMLVQIVPPSGATMVDVLERLERAMPILRRGVAQAITRKRSPDLQFVFVAGAEGSR